MNRTTRTYKHRKLALQEQSVNKLYFE